MVSLVSEIIPRPRSSETISPGATMLAGSKENTTSALGALLSEAAWTSPTCSSSRASLASPASMLSCPESLATTQAKSRFARALENSRTTAIYSLASMQDNYRVTTRLTVNLGLRYEPTLPWREIKGRVQQFRLSGLLADVRST